MNTEETIREETPKYRLGRKQSRVILTQDGTKEIAVVTFFEGHEELAKRVVDALNTEAALQLSKEDEWIPVSEMLPDVGLWVLGYHDYEYGYNMDFYQYDKDSKYWIDRQGHYYTKITFWKPIPQPPKVK